MVGGREVETDKKVKGLVSHEGGMECNVEVCVVLNISAPQFSNLKCLL